MPPLPLVSALGCAVRFDAGERPADEVDAIARAWAGAAVRPEDGLPDRHLTVDVGPGAVTRALARLSQAVTMAAIEARRGELWMLHAGAVADADGNVVAIVGPSGRGKTTATRALAARYGYVSDETVAVAPDGAVLAYRKPLSIIEDPAGDKTQRSPAELGLGDLPAGPLRLSAIVLLDRDPGGPEQAEVVDCALVDVLPELVEQTSYLGQLPRPLAQIAAQARAVGGVRRVVYREASTLADALAPLFRAPDTVSLDEHPSDAPATSPDRQADVAGVGEGVDSPGDRWFRAATLDALAPDLAQDHAGFGRGTPGRMALLQPEVDGGATLRVIDGIGPVLWRAAAGATLTELTAAVVAVHGTPSDGDAETAVAAALDALAAEGVLARDVSWRVGDDVAWTGDDDSFVALALAADGSPEPVSLDGTAGVIWRVLAEARGATVDAIARAVAARAGVTADDIAGDVAAFLRSLADRGLAQPFAP
ncbi:MAG: PqqD family peptide modification chaperone [Microbacterium arborescens]